MNLKKKDTKGHKLRDPISLKCPEQANPRRQEAEWWLLRGGIRGSDCSVGSVVFLDDENVQELAGDHCTAL